MAIQTIEGITAALTNPNIKVLYFKSHSKASEAYIEVEFAFPQGQSWQGLVPYYQPAAHLFLETDDAIAAHLEQIYPLFEPQAVANWVSAERAVGDVNFLGRKITKPFFDMFLSMEWVRSGNGLPDNGNHASRIRDIKKAGYTIVADTNRTVSGVTAHFYRLLPLPRHGGFEYEYMSPKFRARTKRLLNSVDVYEFRVVPESTLLPDHKFPEQRWGNDTFTEDLDSMTDAEIVAKFQLLTNQRNQHKREICRGCYQTGKRGIISGINFFYAGNENWPTAVPREGKSAEAGCVGCGWYDISAWRSALNQLILSGLEDDF